jgi:hypothetical protein
MRSWRNAAPAAAAAAGDTRTDTRTHAHTYTHTHTHTCQAHSGTPVKPLHQPRDFLLLLSKVLSALRCYRNPLLLVLRLLLLFLLPIDIFLLTVIVIICAPCLLLCGQCLHLQVYVVWCGLSQLSLRLCLLRPM